MKSTQAQLRRRILELEAQLYHAYAYAHRDIARASTDHLMASGVLLQLTALGGRELIPSVVIKDGLSPETIAAIRADLKRSQDLASLQSIK